MAISDVVISSLVTGIVGFGLGIFLNQNLSDWLYYKIVRPPLELSSRWIDTTGHPLNEFMRVGNEFNDIISITNVSNAPITIRRMEADLQEADGKEWMRGQFLIFLFKNSDSFARSMKMNKPGLERNSKSHDTGLSPSTRWTGFPKILDIESPIILKPHDSIKIYLGIIGISKQGPAKVRVFVYPVYDYKKTELYYNLIFNQRE
jgi:hypothetical protein